MAQQPRLYHEDIAFPSGTTYVTGGVTITVTEAAQLLKVVSVQITTTGAVQAYVAMAVKNTESGLTFKCQLFQVGATANLLAEIASGDSIETQAVSVLYQGT